MIGCTLVLVYVLFFFFKQKTAYEMRISDWSSDVCSSDLLQRIYVRPKLPHADKRDQTAQDERHDRSGEAVKDKGTPVHAPHSSHAGRVRLEINLRHAKAAALLLALDNHVAEQMEQRQYIDRKSTRLNSSH